LPDWLAAALASHGTPPPQRETGARVETHVVASREAAVKAAAARARELGYRVEVVDDLLEGDALEAGRACAREVLGGPPGMRLWSGETTVRLPPNPGRGGRNQALALAAATGLEGYEHAWLLAAGTDGTDGPTEDAGALVDGSTIARGREQGIDPAEALARADSGCFLAASGDLVHTGPTGTNVMDLVIGLKLGASG
jgi:hydroxypyruvate reductase